MNHIYCISGFGADERVFSNLNFEGYELHFIEWLIPEKKELLGNYVARLTAQIHHPKPVLVGLSFGGMISIEMAKILPVKAVIIISSIKSYHEMPLWMRLAGFLKLNKIVPLRSTKLTEPLQNYNLGLETKEEKEMAKFYRKNINQQYANWATNIVLNWRNVWQPEKIFHIHGDRDNMFPLKKIRSKVVIETGGHMMILNRADKVNAALCKILETL